MIEGDRGERQVLLENPNRTVSIVSPKAVRGSLINYLECNLGDKPMYAFTVKQAEACVDYWIDSAKPVPMPKYIAERDDKDLCFHRLSVNFNDTPKDTLVIDEFISRCSNQEAIKLYIGSLLVENSSRTQYLWIYGPGGEGKGTFGRALVGALGSSCITMAVPKTDSQKQFLTYSLKGKRVCLFPECNNYAFPKDALFKQLTGGDNVWFEQKGKMGHSGKINCKFIFLSNEQPGVNGSSANMRRMIYSEVEKPTTFYPPNVYDALMAAEIFDFLLKCRTLYIEKYPQGDDITYKDKLTDELIEENEEPLTYATDKHLVIGADFYLTAHRLRELSGIEGMSEPAYKNWLRYLKTKFGLVPRVSKIGKKSQRVWLGAREKSSEERDEWNDEQRVTCAKDDQVTDF